MAKLSTLSVELTFLIAEHVDSRSLVDFSHIDRRHYALVDPIRFKREVASGTPTLLCWAARNDRPSVIRKLVKFGVDVCLEDVSGVRPPGLRAIDFQHDIGNSPQSHLGHDGDIPDDGDDRSSVSGEEEPTMRWSALHLAAAFGNLEIVDLLLDNGAHLEQEAYGLCSCGQKAMPRGSLPLFPVPFPLWSALHVAICHGQDATARRLVQRGASLQQPTWIPAWMAELGLDNSAQSPSSQPSTPPPFTALHYTAACGSLAMLQLLLEAMPAGLDEPDLVGNTPLAYAFKAQRKDDAVSFLVGKGASVDCMVDGESTPLILASLRRRFGDVVQLVRLGANVRHRLGGETALHICCGRVDPQYVDLRTDQSLLFESASGSDHMSETECMNQPTKREPETEPSLSDAVQALLDAGAKVDARDSSSRTPLMNAAQHSTFPVVRLLLDAGADPSRTTKPGEFSPHMSVIPLMTMRPSNAVSVLTEFTRGEDEHMLNGGRDTNILRALVQAGADVNHQNDRGWTVLHYLAELLAKASSGSSCGRFLQRAICNIKTLVSSNQVDYTLRNHEGKLAVEYAIVRAAGHISELLPIDKVRDTLTSTDIIRIRDSIIRAESAERDMERTMQALDYLSQINPRSIYDRPDTLFLTIKAGFENLAIQLLEKGADPSYISLTGENVLDIACRKRMGVLAEQLLVLGMSADPVANDRAPPLSLYIDSVLQMALGGPVDWNEHPVILSLLQKGADPHRRLSEGSVQRRQHFFQWHECPLDRIISRGDHDFAKAVLRLCPPPRPGSGRENTPSTETCSYLHRACSFSYKAPDLDLVEFLLSLGLDVNGKTVHGCTVLSEIVDSITPRGSWVSPFHKPPYVVENLDAETTEILLESGEHAPLARTGLFMECIRLLERHGADWTVESAVLTSVEDDQITTTTTPAEELKRKLEYSGADSVSRQGLAYIRSQLVDPDWDPAKLKSGESPFKPSTGKVSVSHGL